MSAYDEDLIMQDADSEPVVRDFIRMMDTIATETYSLVDRQVSKRIAEKLAEKPIEDMITEEMLTNVVQRIYNMLNPTVKEELGNLVQQAKRDIAAWKEQEYPRQRIPNVLRDLAEQLEE